MTRCKDTINLSFTPFFTPLVTPNVTPWLAILPTLVSVVNATFVMHKTTVYKQIYAVWTSKPVKSPLENSQKLSTLSTWHT